MTLQDETYPKFTRNPTRIEQLKVLLSGGTARVFTDHNRFTKPTSIYLYRCPEGMWILDYKHGYPPRQYLNCPGFMNKQGKCPCTTP